MVRMYSWTPDNKASAAAIRYYVRQALRNKVWAYEKATPEWRERSSVLSNKMADDYQHKPVRRLARESLEYHRMRAGLGIKQVGDYPWDKPAHELWNRLQGGQHG